MKVVSSLEAGLGVEVMRTLLIGLLWSVPSLLLAAPMPTVTRFVEFRDGSVLKLSLLDESWPVSLVNKVGSLEDRKLKLSDTKRIVLALEPNFAKKKALLQTIAKLGADEYLVREAAHKELVKQGSAIRADLLMLRDRYTDIEILSRLKEILAELPDKDKTISNTLSFDQFISKETVWGEAGEFSLGVALANEVKRLSRKDLVSISENSPEVERYTQVGTGLAVRRLTLEEMPKGCIEEGFENTPEGRALTIGENIEKLFISKGFTLSTSIKTSHVSVNDYVVQGKSKGKSSATHAPVWQGEITVTFNKPGAENVPAGVHYVGLYCAYVEVNGTALHAYDFQGNELGKVAVQKREHDFLGLYSPVLIHKVKIVPNVQIDPDYTFDDLTFSPPQPKDSAHPDKCTVITESGERILCKDVEFAPGRALLQGLTVGLPDLSYELKNIRQLLAPAPPDRPKPTGIYVEMLDRSLLFGKKPEVGNKPYFALAPDLLQDSSKIMGIWSSQKPRSPWPALGKDGTLTQAGTTLKLPLLFDSKEGNGGPWRSLAAGKNLKLLDSEIYWEPPTPKENPVAAVRLPYFEMTPLLLQAPEIEVKKPEGVPTGSWRLRTTDEDDLFLTDAEVPELAGKMTQSITTRWAGKELKLAGRQLASIVRVK